MEKIPLQCFDTIGHVSGRASDLQKNRVSGVQQSKKVILYRPL